MSADEKRALAAGLAFLICVLCGGCRLGPGVDCPPGTFPQKAASSRKVDGTGKVGASAPTASGDANGTWSGSGSSEWQCKRLCPKGTAIRLLLEKGRQSVECLPIPVRDGGPRHD